MNPMPKGMINSAIMIFPFFDNHYYIMVTF